MAKVGLVAGEEVTDLLDKKIFSNSDIEVTYKPFTLDNMIDNLSTGGLQLQELKAVMILDYAFQDDGESNMEQTVAEKFVRIQDLMVSEMLDTKLYLLTRNSDLYDKLKGTVQGISGTYYHGTQVMIIKNDYQFEKIRSVLNGEYDNTGLYNKEAVLERDKKKRLEKEKDDEIELRRNLSKEYLDIDKNTPTTTMSDVDYIDTEKRKVEDNKKKKDQEKESKDRDRGINVEDDENNEQEDDGSKLVVNVQQETDEGKKTKEEDDRDEEQLQELFENISKDNDKVGLKLKNDEGIISFVGDNDAGTSGLVANVADMYMAANKKVLVVDMDFHKRMQTVYFKSYSRNAEKGRGSTRALIDAIQGYGVEDSAVKITDNLNVLSISGDEDVGDDFVYALSGGIDTLLLEAKDVYDIILLDVPSRHYSEYVTSLDEVDKNIFVVENKFYKIENFIGKYLFSLLEDGEIGTTVEEIVRKSNIIINKFKRNQHDLEGKEINRKYLRKVLNDVGYPFDRIGVAGEIPFYEQWEYQFFKGIRYIWIDDLSLGVYRRVFDKVVL